MKHIIASIALVAVTGLAMANPARDCPNGHVKAGAVAETKALMASLDEAMDRQQAQLDAAIRDAAARAKWSEQERAKFFQALLRSKPNADFEKQIGALTVELRKLLQASQRGEVKGPAADCAYVAQVRRLIAQLKLVLERQSAYLDRQLRNVR